MSANPEGVLGVFSHMDALIDGIKHFKSKGMESKMKVYSPAPLHAIDDALDEPPSPVRLFTLFGGMLGCTFGYTFTAFSSMDWILPTSGKPIVAPIAFTVIAFELTVLFGAIFTLLGIVVNARLFRKRKLIYDERFTEDKFGIYVSCPPTEYDAMEKVLSECGAEEVKRA